jgi:tetratricopeptide (TPR) repeat protein
VEQAKESFQLGSALYDKGKYAQAIKEFQVGAALKPDPAFDYDIAKCYRKLNDLPHAKQYLVKTLNEAPPDSPYRTEAEQDLGAVEATLAAPSGSSSHGADSWASPSVGGRGEVVLAATATLGVGLFATGVVFGLLGSSAENELDSKPPSQAQADSDLRNARGYYLSADILIPVGLVAAGVAGWQLWREERQERPPSTHMSFFAAPRVGVSIGLGGSF